MKKKKISCASGWMFLCFFFFFLAAPWHGLSPALAAKPPTDKVPGPLLKWPEKGSECAILVDKSLQKVFVYHRDDPSKPLRTYTCSTGENQGPKLRENDRKTPEGVYFFVRAIEKRELLPIYGSRAFALDYPNVMDRREGKNGHGIWFHGLNKPLKPRDTNGCVALENKDIDDLAQYIQIEDTPVIVSDRIEMVDLSEIEKERDEVIQIIEAWRTSWEKKDLDRYMPLYSPDFNSSGKNWEQWKEHKSRLARRYSRIKVEVQNLRILQNDGLVLASFVQKYHNEYFSSSGRKTLYLRHGSRLRIIAEDYEGGELKPAVKRKVLPPEEIKPVIAKIEIEGKAEKPAPVPADKDSAPAVEGVKPVAAKKEQPPSGGEHRELKKMLEAWKKAWEKKDLNAYMSFYDSGFQSRGMDLKAWKKHREKLNKKYRTIAVGISELKIEQTSPAVASIRFTQKYDADDYEDEGLKCLVLVKRGKGWKIKEEEWKPLDRESNP